MVAGTFEELAVAGESTRLYSCGRDRVSAGVVIFHPWWGLNDDVIAYADRLAGSGFAVLAPDLVRGRTASTIEQAERLAREKEDGHADAAALAAIDRLAGPGRGARIGAVGFSMGAAWAMWCAAQRDAVAASVIYYGTIAGPSLEQAIVPVLGLALGPAAVVVSWRALRRGRADPRFGEVAAARAGLVLGTLSSLTSWAGLALIVEGLRVAAFAG